MEWGRVLPRQCSQMFGMSAVQFGLSALSEERLPFWSAELSQLTSSELAMSETLNTPWIADYLIHIAETYGSNLTNVPVHIKPGRKVQLLKVSPIPRGVTQPTRSLRSNTAVPHFSTTHSRRLRLGLCL